MTKPLSAEEKAAQLWCLPQHSNKVMDPDFCKSIAAALKAEREEALEEAAKFIEEKCDKECTVCCDGQVCFEQAKAIRSLKESS